MFIFTCVNYGMNSNISSSEIRIGKRTDFLIAVICLNYK